MVYEGVLPMSGAELTALQYDSAAEFNGAIWSLRQTSTDDCGQEPFYLEEDVFEVNGVTYKPGDCLWADDGGSVVFGEYIQPCRSWNRRREVEFRVFQRLLTLPSHLRDEVLAKRKASRDLHVFLRQEVSERELIGCDHLIHLKRESVRGLCTVRDASSVHDLEVFVAQPDCYFVALKSHRYREATLYVYDNMPSSSPNVIPEDKLPKCRPGPCTDEDERADKVFDATEVKRGRFEERFDAIEARLFLRAWEELLARLHCVQEENQEDECDSETNIVKIKSEMVSPVVSGSSVEKNGLLSWGTHLSCDNFVGLPWTRDLRQELWSRVEELSHKAAQQRRMNPNLRKQRLSSTVLECPPPAPVACSNLPVIFAENSGHLPNGIRLLMSNLKRNDSGDSDDAAQEVEHYMACGNHRHLNATPTTPLLQLPHNDYLQRSNSTIATQAYSTAAEPTADERMSECQVTSPEGAEAGGLMDVETKSNDGEGVPMQNRIKTKRGGRGGKKRKKRMVDVNWVKVLESQLEIFDDYTSLFMFLPDSWTQHIFDTLHQCNYNVERTLQTFPASLPDLTIESVLDESGRKLFKYGLKSYGKNFPVIQTLITNKSTRALINYYYHWKNTPEGRRWHERGGWNNNHSKNQQPLQPRQKQMVSLRPESMNNIDHAPDEPDSTSDREEEEVVRKGLRPKRKAGDYSDRGSQNGNHMHDKEDPTYVVNSRALRGRQSQVKARPNGVCRTDSTGRQLRRPGRPPKNPPPESPEPPRKRKVRNHIQEHQKEVVERQKKEPVEAQKKEAAITCRKQKPVKQPPGPPAKRVKRGRPPSAACTVESDKKIPTDVIEKVELERLPTSIQKAVKEEPIDKKEESETRQPSPTVVSAKSAPLDSDHESNRSTRCENKANIGVVTGSQRVRITCARVDYRHPSHIPRDNLSNRTVVVPSPVNHEISSSAAEPSCNSTRRPHSPPVNLQNQQAVIEQQRQVAVTLRPSSTHVLSRHASPPPVAQYQHIVMPQVPMVVRPTVVNGQHVLQSGHVVPHGGRPVQLVEPQPLMIHGLQNAEHFSHLPTQQQPQHQQSVLDIAAVQRGDPRSVGYYSAHAGQPVGAPVQVVAGPPGMHFMPVHASHTPQMLGTPVLMQSQAYTNTQLPLSPNSLAAARLPALQQCQPMFVSGGPPQLSSYYQQPRALVLLQHAGP